MSNIGGTTVPPELNTDRIYPEPICAGPERYKTNIKSNNQIGNAIIVIHFKNNYMLYTNFANPKIGSKGVFDNNEEKYFSRYQRRNKTVFFGPL